MLQQTQVATVRAYFERFLAAFPTIDDLAQADEQQVLRLWEGLGYYRRARQLHEAAKIIAREHGGEFPRDVETVRRLPGIGRYTAGAILSITFDARQPILEANTQRLLSRLLGYEGSVASSEGQRLLWGLAEAVLPAHGVGKVNQALMDLGSMICTPRGPRCESCPVAMLCRANQLGLQAEIPRPKTKPRFEDRHEVAVIVRRSGRVLLVQCAEGERWAGLWDFPRFAVESADGAAMARELTDLVHCRTGVWVKVGQRLATLKHGVTRFRITLDCYEADFVSADGVATATHLRWLRPSELADYPLNTTGRKLARFGEGGKELEFFHRM
jgi:A/G-specific adenine glycosylase